MDASRRRRVAWRRRGNQGRTRGFQLWIALPPELELAPSASLYQGPEDIQHDGPASVLLGSYGAATSAIEAPSPINYLAVRLKAGSAGTTSHPQATRSSGRLGLGRRGGP